MSKYERSLGEWLGDSLSSVQKIRGAPLSTDENWPVASGEGAAATNYIKLAYQKLHMSFSRKIRMTWLTGIYDHENDVINASSLADLIKVLRITADKVVDYDMRSVYARANATKQANSTASVAKHTFTVGGSKYWKIVAISGANATNAPQWQLSIKKSGGTERVLCTMGGVGRATVYYNLMGVCADTNPESTGMSGMELFLAPGDEIYLEDLNFTAADDMDVNLTYEEY